MNKEPIPDFTRFKPKTEHFKAMCRVDTSPGGLRDNRPHLMDNVQAVGIGDVSPEQTLDIAYILRAAPGTPLEAPRSLMPGEIGWGIPWLVDVGTPKIQQQIPLEKFLKVPKDRPGHENMEVWRPGPEECKPPAPGGQEDTCSNMPDEVMKLLPYSAVNKDTSQAASHREVLSRGRFRPLEATQHLGVYRNC